MAVIPRRGGLSYCCSVLLPKEERRWTHRIADAPHDVRRHWKAGGAAQERLGIGLYGIGNDKNLKAVAKLQSNIAQIRSVNKGEKVGYDSTFTANEDMKIGIVPLGYADGINRKLGNNNGHVLVDETPAKILGKISMDSMLIDLRKVEAKEGDIVTIFDAKNKLSSHQKKKIIKIITILIIIILLVNLGFSYKLFLMIEYDDKTYDGILEEIQKIFVEKKSVRLVDNLSLEIKEVLGKQPDIQNSYVMATGLFPVYYANSKVVYANFTEGNENESLESYITRKNWSELDYYMSNVDSFPSDRNDIFHPIPDYLLFIPLPQLEIPTNLKILEDPTNPLIPSNFELIFQSDKTGMIIYKINHNP